MLLFCCLLVMPGARLIIYDVLERDYDRDGGDGEREALGVTPPSTNFRSEGGGWMVAMFVSVRRGRPKSRHAASILFESI